jgi:hypothetical protein
MAASGLGEARRMAFRIGRTGLIPTTDPTGSFATKQLELGCSRRTEEEKSCAEKKEETFARSCKCAGIIVYIDFKV